MRIRTLRSVLAGLGLAALAAVGPTAGAAAEDDDRGRQTTRTPIGHLIVVVGENHTFDNLFGGYQPADDQTVSNLLSKGIIKADGTPGPNFASAAQQQASDTKVYLLAPAKTGRYATLPQPQTTYAVGVPPGVPDARFPADLPNGPFQITKYVPYDSFTGDPIHRFWQMWQQVDEGKLDLFPWVAVTVGIGPQNSPPAPTPGHTFQGGEAMGFFNMSAGDAPHFAELARRYAISDNYHQPIMGGTGANFIALVTGDAGFYNIGSEPKTPPLNQIEMPDPQPQTNNFYTQDGYAGGSYVNCADPGQPGVGEIRRYLDSLRHRPDSNCEPGHYYLVNNYGLGFTASGQPKPFGAPNQFTLPPQSFPTIGDALSAKGVSWKYYSGGRTSGAGGTPSQEYCGICDPLTGFTSIMTTALKDNLQDVTQFYQNVASDATLPAVSFVRPFESMAGHPANSNPAKYEGFVIDLIARVQANPAVWGKTAILITTDEGGGYYDSGYIQPLDFFGDGTRIPLIAVSPFAKPGFVDHTYSDHVSILKFIERNWELPPLSDRSRDTLPNPVTRPDEPYVPLNGPAIGDLMDLFTFEELAGGRE